MKTINYFEIVVKTYNGEPVARIRFDNNGTLEESALYSLSEVNNIVALWRMGELCGSFGIGCQLAENARFQLVTE